MPTQVQFRRGNTAQVQAFTGAVGEIAIDTQRKQISLQDGTTSGGIYAARQDFTQAAFNTANSAASGTYAAAAFDTANAAYTKANSANVIAEAAYAWGNTVNVFTGSAFSKANIANITAEAGFAKANAANVLAQSAFDKANTIMPSANANTSAYASKYFVEFNPTTNTFSYTSYPDASNPYITGYGPEIHVSPVALNDSGRGTIGDPVKTIARAQVLAALAFETTAAGQRKTIILHPGDYTENVTIDTTFTVLTTHELVGKNTTLSGTLTLNKGCTVDGLKMTNLVISGTSANGSVDIVGCTVTTSASKTESAYVNFRACDLSSAALSVTGTGTVIMVGGNYGSLTVSNPYAGVLAKAVTSMGPTTLIAGTLNISDTLVYAANNTANAITQSSGSVLTLNNSQVLIPDFTNVSRMSLTGYYSILHSVYDKTNSRLQGNTSLSSISYSQFINLDRLILSSGGQITYPDGSIQISSNGIQSAFTQANTANVTGEAAFAKANTANVTGEAAFAKANVANTIAQSAYDHANTKFATAGGSISGNVTVTGNVTPGTANVYTLGTAASPWKEIYVGPSSLYIGDIKLSSVGGALQLDNATNFVIANTSIPNSSVISTTANAAFDKANVANTTAEAAYAWANSINTFAVGVAASAFTANTTAEAGFAKANIANTTAEAGFAKANAVLTYAGSGYGLANTTAVITQAAFDNSNTKFNSSGGTITGAVTISGNNNLTVSGNLIVQGTTFSSNTTTFEINDPLLLLGFGNYFSDTRDIGFSSHYNDGTNAHSGLIRDSGTKEYYFFKGYTLAIDANNNVDISHASFATANVNAGKITANVVANTVTLDNGLRTSNTYTTAAANTQVSVDSFSTSIYRSAKYQAQMTAGTNYHAIELLLIHDGTTANLVQYAEVVTTSSLGTFDASITTGVLSLLFTPASATATTIKVIRDSINV